MAGPASPVSGFSHVQLIVSDLVASEHWYSTVLGLERMVAADDGSYVALRHRPSKVVVVLTVASEAVSEAAGASHLDHLAFAAPDGASLEVWAHHLNSIGIDNPGVVDELGKPSLILRDPDGIQIELVAPPGS
jgi:catechol-2,3-dioxygenase